MGYSTGCHTTFHHRYHLVWAPKYRFKVQRGEVCLRVREIIRQICAEMGGRRSSTLCSYATMSICSLKSRLTSRSATSSAAQKDAHCAKIQQEFEHIRKRYWGQRFRGRGYFSTTSDNIILRYLDRHNHNNGFSHSV